MGGHRKLRRRGDVRGFRCFSARIQAVWFVDHPVPVLAGAVAVIDGSAAVAAVVAAVL